MFQELKNQIGYFPIILFVLSALIIFYSSIHKEYLETSEYYELTRQLTPDKKYYIYHYARFGGMAFSSDIIGSRLLEKDERFAENVGKEFPYTIDGWLSKDTVVVNGFDRPGIDADTFPSRTEYEKVKDFTIKQVYYKSRINGGGGIDYKCDSIFISNGRLIIIGNKGQRSCIGANEFPIRSNYHIFSCR